MPSITPEEILPSQPTAFDDLSHHPKIAEPLRENLGKAKSGRGEKTRSLPVLSIPSVVPLPVPFPLSPAPNPPPAPFSAVFRLTGSCNLRCDYCFEAEHPVEHMTKEVAGRAIEWLLDSCTDRARITFFGGEPLIRKSMISWLIPTAVGMARDRAKRIGFSITTNGTLLDEATAESLRQARVSIQLSTDGVAEGHNRHRRYANGKGSFDDVRRAIPLIRAACPSASVRMTITPDNVSEMAEGVAFYASEGFDQISPSPVLEANWTEDSMAQYASQLESVASLFIWYALQGRFLDIMGISSTIGRSLKEQGTYSCGAGRGLVAIDVDGSIFPCHRFIGYTAADPRWRIGDVWNGFYDQNRDYFLRLNSREMKGCTASPTGKAGGGCFACNVFDQCGGGCMAINLKANGDPSRPPVTSFAFKKLSLEKSHGVMTFLERHAPQIWDALVARISGLEPARRANILV